jgi:hypothetical protein
MQKSTVFLLVMALASTGVSAGLWMQLRAERELNAELSDRLIAAAATPIAASPDVLPPVEPPATAPAATPPPAITPAVVTTAAAEPEAAKAARASQEHWQTRQRRLMSDPRFREAYREQQRLLLATPRENFIRLLGFTSEQADAVIDMSIERQMESQNRSNVVSAEEIQKRKESMEAQERDYQAKLQNLLGADKSAQLQTYMESRQSRMQVDRFRTQLTGGDMLRDDQVEPLIAALHVEQAQMQKEMQEYRDADVVKIGASESQLKYAERQAELMKAAHGRMRSAASGILSNSQLDMLDAMLKRDRERLEAQQRMSRIQSKLEQPSVVETPPR